MNKAISGVQYSADVAITLCELLAEGKTLIEVCKLPNMPSRNSVYRWLALYPKFFEAYQRAKELSAHSLEEEALLMARTLKGQNDFTSVKVQAYSIAMQQLRWSASHRDKVYYGNTDAGGNNKVPITINTTLNVGQLGPATSNEQSVYSVSIEVPVSSEPHATSAPDAPEYDLDLTANVDDTIAEPPAYEVEPRVVPRSTLVPKRGKRHKSPAQAALTAKRYAEKERKRLAAKSEE